ncbi:MAG: hypothetical protein IJO32_00620 [Bacilli bacterium]|nr:hypothetical protein [Bacilli bacterium]
METKDKIKKYLEEKFSKEVNDIYDIDYFIEETIDRALNYMNRDNIPERLERIITRAVVGVIKSYKNEILNDEIQHEIKSISDNGQTISYGDVINFMNNKKDAEIFDGIIIHLDKYRLGDIV